MRVNYWVLAVDSYLRLRPPCLPSDKAKKKKFCIFLFLNIWKMTAAVHKKRSSKNSSLIRFMLYSYLYKVMSDSAQECKPLLKQTRRNGIYFGRFWLPWTLSGRVPLWYDICQLSNPNCYWLKQPNITPFQDSIPEYLQYIYNTVDHNKALIGQKIFFSMPFGCYIL